MTPRFVRPCLALVLSAAALAVRAQQPAANPPPLPTNPPAAAPARGTTGPGGTTPAATPATTPANSGVTAAPGTEEEMVQVKLPDADLDTILGALEIYTGKVILRPAQLPTTTYNLNLKKAIPKSAAIRYLETVLAMNQIALTPLDEFSLKVTPLTTARTEAPELITGSTLDLAPSGRVGVKLFQLEFIRIAELLMMLQGVLNPNYGGALQLPNANAVLITDSISNLQRVETLLQQVDKPMMSGVKAKFYSLHNAKATDVVNKIRGILQGTLQVQLGQATTYSADDRTSQVIVVTDPRQYAFFDDLIARLDAPGDANTRNEVIPLMHADAQQVSTVISQIVKGQTAALQSANALSARPGQNGATMPPPSPVVNPGQPAPAPNPTLSTPGLDSVLGTGSNEFSTLVTIIPDIRSNAVVVSGTIDDIALIKKLIEKLDTILAQVRIDMVIAEVSLDDNESSGISALGLKVDGDRLVGFSGASPGFTVSNGTITRPGGTSVISGPWDLAAEIAIGTTPRKNNTSILSVPSITTTHAKEATFISSEQRPIISGSQQSITGGTTTPVTSSTIVQQDIGITLTVKPLIGSDGSVQMDITQDVRDVAGAVTIDGNEQPIISHRQTKSFITAHDGEIIVVGGMQRKRSQKTTSRLGPIPIIGDLFGSRTNDKTRTELIFFMRPHILTNSPADNASTLKRIDELPEKNRNEIRQTVDPTFVPPKTSIIDKILPR
jgi:general secretion pathway protein D